MENVENKILEVLEDVGEKMAPVIKVRSLDVYDIYNDIAMQDFLLKTTNLVTYAARDKNSLLNFLDENLV
jgi:hypothetical protein